MPSTSSAVAAAPSPSRSATTTARAPAAAKARAAAAPIPAAPPVTTTWALSTFTKPTLMTRPHERSSVLRCVRGFLQGDLLLVVSASRRGGGVRAPLLGGPRAAGGGDPRHRQPHPDPHRRGARGRAVLLLPGGRDRLREQRGVGGGDADAPMGGAPR